MLGGSSGLEFDSHLKIPKSRVGLESSSGGGGGNERQQISVACIPTLG